MLGTWLEIELLAQDAAGACNVYVNGSATAFVSFAGDTRNSTTTDGWDSVAFSYSNTNDNAYDDVIVTTNAEGRPNEVFCLGLAPNGNDVIQSTSSGGGAGTYTNVDDLPFSSTDYNIFTSGQQDTYDCAALPWTPTLILGAKVASFAAREGTIVSAQGVCKSGGVTSLGSATGLGSAGSYVAIDTYYNTDPATAAAWVAAGIDAAKIGIKF
jgi:hypothetical protein